MAVSVHKKHLFFTYNQTQIQQDSIPSGVFIGDVGSGKTTNFNKITNKNQKTSNHGTSTTRNSFRSSSAYGESFYILDTPGTSADDDKIGHALCLRSALIEGPINRIFILIEYHHKFGILQKNISEKLKLLYKWKHLITVIITHWDRDDTPENRSLYEETKEKLMKKDPSLQNSFIFVGKDSDPEELCNAIYKSLCQNKAVQLDINLQEFRYTFDLFENFDQYIIEYKNYFDKVSKYMLKEMLIYSDSDKDEFLHACNVLIAKIAEEILEDFENKYGKDMIEVDSFMHYLELKSYFIPIVEQVRKAASQNMSYSLLNPQAPQNLLKQCPNCGQIWLKVAGCDNTTCGNRQLEKDYYSGGKSFMKFTFDWRNLLWKKQQQKEVENKGTYNSNVKGLGCGKPLNWLTAPPIGIETLKMLNETGISDILADQSKEFQKKSESFNQNLIKKGNESQVKHI
ncbi:50S ribosome-binding GTPase (macronuclear) [Tetrahymena thermophila SB210]|uniref:50S ribosome-binding GTPase n=1 Tax=Tetrahymena thermophila (strain SB210) TaxID=312017 RepID=Q23YH3_TETTS|nr:50S ribosome-binding GTPase [Tetrahymena thermophila SB210]EAS01560.1 50S ribosome-binding GTPase [Tetrahymena thermophila SB210]|eukprot:XP_001021805.1 50S ribosome-binding GTPase [Tetrahymena thermophila SB210]